MRGKLTGKLQARSHYVDEVYRILQDSIIDGTLAPGARVTQEEIAEQLNVSRSPVLQAMQLLRKDGLLLDAEGRGVMVAPLGIGQIGHLYEVRGALEALATRLAAEKSAIIDAALIHDGRRVAKGKDVRAMIDADVAFHQAIYHASGNPLIAASAQLHWAHLRRVMGIVLQSADQRTIIWDEHEQLADVIASGDVVKAVQICNMHMDNARIKLLERLEVLLEVEA